MRIRRARESDLPAIVECAVAAWLGLDPTLDVRDERRYARACFGEYCLPSRRSPYLYFRCDVAVAGDRIVGFVAYCESRAGHWIYNLEELGVHPDFQGRGIGTRLLRHALTTMRMRPYGGPERGVRIRHIMLTTNNPVAERLYAAHGARVVEKDEVAGKTRTFMLFAWDAESPEETLTEKENRV